MKNKQHDVITVQSLGESMTPLIKNGSKVVVDFKSALPYRLGEIVVFLLRKKLVVHRVLKVRRTMRGNEYLLKGDNNPMADGWFKEKYLLGRVKRVIYPSHQVVFTDKKAAILRYVFVLYSYLTGLRNVREGWLKIFFRPLYHFIFFLHSKTRPSLR